MDKLEKWIMETLECETVPDFEKTPETLAMLEALMKQHQDNQLHKNLRENLMKKEIEEFQADEKRLKQNLTALDLNPEKDLSQNLTKCARSLTKTAGVLGTIRPTESMLNIGLTSFLETKDKTSLELMKTKMSCTKLERGNLKAAKFKDQIEKKLDELETSLSEEMKKAETVQKSTKFHMQKKKEYQRQMIKCENELVASGYRDDISHSTLVTLGDRAHGLDETIKPHRLQLNSYKCLPPNTERAKLMLQEKVAELKMVEDELHDVFQNIRLVQ